MTESRNVHEADGREQPTLPLMLEGAVPLPFDDEADRPVDMVLTARGRLAVGAADLPELRVVPGARGAVDAKACQGDGAAAERLTGERIEREDPFDTRPSQARALRRAGRSTAEIAERLQVDELLVRAWCLDVGSSGARWRARVPGGGATSASTLVGRRSVSAPSTSDVALTRVPARGAETDTAGNAKGDEHRTSFELARAAARDLARDTRLKDARFSAGLGLLAGVGEFDPHAVTVTTADVDVAAAVLAWIREQLDVAPGRIRVALRIGQKVAGDLAAHRWAKQLGVERSQVAIATWRTPPSVDAEQVLVRIADPTVAATLAGWRDALLSLADGDPADIAF